MTFEDSISLLQKILERNGYTAIREPIDIAAIVKDESVKDCEIIASKDQYDVLYLEAKSNWKSIAGDVAKKQSYPSLVITLYKESYLILTTTTDHYTLNTKPRHVVIDVKSKTHSFEDFAKLIKTTPKDNRETIETKIHSTFEQFSEYVEAIKEFEDNLDKIIQKTEKHVNAAIKDSKKYATAANKFLKTCKKLINPSTSIDDIRDMLIQHILTYRIFAMVYDENDFHNKNAVAKQLESLKKLLDMPHMGKVDYSTMEVIAESITDMDKKQEFLKKLYETFYKKHNPKKVDKDGIVYTPSEVVNFMVISTDQFLKKHFSKSLADDGVIILDPATGTGTFPVHILKQIGADKIESKYDKEIYANDISILPYYIAALNIENTYQEMRGQYREFENICWMDTLDSGSKNYEKLPAFSDNNENIERIDRQQNSRINVIIGNPPYSVGQKSFDDRNPNWVYSELDARIRDTYVKEAKNNLKNSLYDSYIRFIRWASDRIGDSGIITFITNAGFIKSEAGAGIRACFAEEFNEIWCFDLRGNQNTQGETSCREGGKIFGSGSRTPTAITILIKNPKKKSCTIYYKDIGDYHSREKKLSIIQNAKSMGGITDWQTIKPDKHHDWINKRNANFEQYKPIGSKVAKSSGSKKTKSNNKKIKSGDRDNAVFKIYSNGVKTNRDVWAYNSSKEELTKNMKKHIDYCDTQKNSDKPKFDSKQAKWSPELSERLKKSTKQKFDKNKIRMSLYRPFFKQLLYFDHIFNERRGLQSLFFPNNDSENLVISVPYKFTGEFSTFMTNITPDLQIVMNGQYFPLYIYDHNVKKENILDFTLTEYQTYYNDKKITKQDTFYYVYGLLHHQGYKKEFANNLTKVLPRIPMAPDFWKFSKAGKQLAGIHLNFEICERYSLGKPKHTPKNFTKISFARKTIEIDTDDDKLKKTKNIADKTTIRADGTILFDNLPEINYKVNGRTPIEWIIDRYQKTMDKDSGITNDPCTGTDIISVIERATYIGTESDKIIKKLSKLDFEPKNYIPKKTGMDQFTNTSNAQTVLD